MIELYRELEIIGVCLIVDTQCIAYLRLNVSTTIFSWIATVSFYSKSLKRILYL